MEIFRADKYFEKFEDVKPDLLKEAGVNLLLCDLDNTLRLHSEKEPTESLQKWIKGLHKAGIEVVIVSNNGRKKMMQKFCEPIGVPCVWWAMKPSSKKLTNAMKERNYTTKETVMLGDKRSTDVLAAKFAKIPIWKVDQRRNIV